MRGDIRRPRDLILVAHDEHAIPGRNDVRLDGVSTLVDGQLIGELGVLRTVAARPTMGYHERPGGHSSKITPIQSKAMETCVGCGSPLAPSWKFCIHCGLAVDPPEIPGAIRPDDGVPAVPPARSRALLIGGVGIFVVGVALLVLAIALFAGAFH
jgi:hypothetical protein